MNKKKNNLCLYLIGVVASCCFGYLVGGAYRKGIQLQEFLNRFQAVLEKPFKNYWNEDSLKIILFFGLAYIIGLFMYLSSKRELMSGKEHGTAKFADVHKMCKRLKDKEEAKNRILSQNMKVSTDGRMTKINNNMLVIGGAGSGKSFYCVRPNIFNLSSSIVVTDPKGELLASTGNLLRKNGFRVKVINLVEMSSSDCYNPFKYINSETDVIKLITNLMANTTPKDAQKGDPFWEKSEQLYLQALFLYVWMEKPAGERNFNTVLDLLNKAEVHEDGKKSELDQIFEKLKSTSELGENHPALRQYYKCVRGAGDTVRSIIISANSRLAYFENPELKRILSRDDMDLESIGIGIDGDGKTKTALFCVTADNDKSYNFVIGMLYTQLFQRLYYEADFHFNGSLPVPVTFWLDEYPSVALPEDILAILATCRSRNISIVPIVQNLSQLKVLHKDSWEVVVGNCDCLLYLGGNEQSSHKFVSEMLGKFTLTKRSTGESRGRNGSSSRNYDVIGRELMSVDEVRKMDNKKCLLFIRGYDPIIDYKYHTPKHPRYGESWEGGGERYLHRVNVEKQIEKEKGFELLNDSSLTYFKRKKEQGENIYINELTLDEFLSLGNREGEHKKNASPITLKRILKRMEKGEFNEEQLEELRLGMEAGLTEEQILMFFQCRFSANKMCQLRLALQKEAAV